MIHTYGEQSSAALLLKFHDLLSALKIEDAERIDFAYKVLLQHYKIISENLTPGPHQRNILKRVTLEGNEISTYSREKFSSVRQIALGNEAIRTHPDNLFHICPSGFHLYAVSEDGTVLTSKNPIPISALLLGRNPGGFTHAHLVEDFDLSVRSSGEIVCAKTQERLHGIIITNRSGHFQPSRSALNKVIPIIATSFGLHRSKIFPLAVDREPRN